MSTVYGKEYYEVFGTDNSSYETNELLKSFFSNVAERIVEDFHPKTVLDAGCAMGYLVVALRDLGVEAYGIDISDYAISRVRDDVRPYCAVCSLGSPLPEEFPSQYDLVTTIEVIEHLNDEDGKKAIRQLCSLTDQIMFSSSPYDYEEPTHINVQQREYWAGLFAANGLYDDLSVNLSYITPHAVFYSKKITSEALIDNYERYIAQMERARKCGQVLSPIQSKIYFCSERGESEDNMVQFSSLWGNEFQQKVMIPDGCQRIRFDPMEGAGCLLWNLHIMCNGALLEPCAWNGQKIGKVYLFQTFDPYLYIDIPRNSAWVEIRAEFHPMDQEGWLLLCRDLRKLGEPTNEASESVASSLEPKLESTGIDIVQMRKKAKLVMVAPPRKSKSAIRRIFKPFRLMLRVIKALIRLMFKCITWPFVTVWKVLRSLFTLGFRATFGKIADKVRKKDSPAEISLVNAEQFSITANPIDKIDCVLTDEPIKRLNLVTDTIHPESLLGGVTTALIVATEFANRYDYELRIITRSSEVSPRDYTSIMRTIGISPARKISFYSDCDRHIRTIDYKLEISSDDVFLATSWWSAKAIEKTSIRERFFYIIQEVETFFYNYGGERLLCEQMMRKTNIDYIVNSGYLYQYFATHEPNITEHGCYFEPAFPKKLYCKKSFRQKSHYKLFFYARPDNPNNLFSVGASMLQKAVEQGILDTSEWDIYCVGQDVPVIHFENGRSSINLGQLSWTEYAEFLSDVDLGLCLMYTPHPGYPPFDVACSGGVVLSNKMANKVSFDSCRNVILSELDEQAFMESFKKAVELAKDMKKREENFAKNTILRDWHAALTDTVTYMGERMNNV